MFSGAVSEGEIPVGRSAKDALMLTGDAANTREAVRLLLSRSGLSAAEVARRLGVTRQTVQQFVTQRRPSIQVRSLAEVAAVCGGRVIVELPE
jgi:DNA-binding CsgD family transcriptional regulator